MKDALVTRRELAVERGVHMMTITKWEHEGMPIAERGRRGKPSRYSIPAVRAWLDHREEAARIGTSLDLVQERARKEHAQAILAEQTVAIRAGELVPREDGLGPPGAVAPAQLDVAPLPRHRVREQTDVQAAEVVRDVRLRAGLGPDAIGAEIERTEEPLLPVEPRRDLAGPVPHVLGGVGELRDRLRVLGVEPPQRPQEELKVLRPVVPR